VQTTATGGLAGEGAAPGGLKRVLGVPLTTSTEYTTAALNEKVLSHQSLLSSIQCMAQDFPDEAARLLRWCGVRRLQYDLMMLDPLSVTAGATQRADAAVFDTYSAFASGGTALTDPEAVAAAAAAAPTDAARADLLAGGAPLPSFARAQMRLPEELGGAGLISMTDMADAASIASWAATLPLIARRCESTPGMELLAAEIATVETSELEWARRLRDTHARVEAALEVEFSDADRELLGAILPPPATPYAGGDGSAVPRPVLLQQRAPAWRAPDVVLPELAEFCDVAAEGSRPPHHGLYGAIAHRIHLRQFIDLWHDEGTRDIDRARLGACAGQTAGASVLALGQWESATAMAPDHFLVATRRALGAPLAACSTITVCPGCTAPITHSQGTGAAELATLHFPCCAGACMTGRGGRDITAPQLLHTAMKKTLHKIVLDAGQYAVEEAPGLIADSQQRPGDVTIMNLVGATHTIAVDVSLARLMVPSAIDIAAKQPGKVIEMTETGKYNLYADHCRTNGIHFTPFVMDEYGHIGAAGMSLLHWLARRAVPSRTDGRHGRTVGARQSYLVQRWSRWLSTTIHSSAAQITMTMALRARRTAAAAAPGVGA
jgi:hypothetical protein